MKRTKGNLRYAIAERFFSRELDEAWDQGVAVGAEFATRTISFRIGVKEATQELTKTQKIGYDKANEIVQSCKEDIRKTTGAMV